MRVVSGGSVGDEVALTPALLAFRRRFPNEKIALTVRRPELFDGLSWLDEGTDSGRVVNVALGGDDVSHLAQHYGQQLGVRVFDTRPMISLTTDELVRARDILLERAGSGRLLLAVDTWAGWPSRRYPHWDTALNVLRGIRSMRGDPEITVVEVGATVPDCFGETRGERRLHGADVSLVDQLSLRETAAAIAYCGAYAGNDSGLAHIAAAVATPNVVAYAPKPWWSRAYESTVPVYPAKHPHGCSERCHESCIATIDPVAIAEAIDFALGSPHR